jgi:hypothetical protein
MLKIWDAIKCVSSRGGFKPALVDRPFVRGGL